MSAKKNYGFYLEGDDTAKFKEWREKLNGLVNSNMEMIDEVLAEKAIKSQSFQASLTSSDWVWTGSKYSQTLEIEGLTPDTNGIIGVGQNLTLEQTDAVYMAELMVGDQTDGALTIFANGDKPYCDIPVIIILLG